MSRGICTKRAAGTSPAARVLQTLVGLAGSMTQVRDYFIRANVSMFSWSKYFVRVKKFRVGVQLPELQAGDDGRSVFDKGDRFLPSEIVQPLLNHLRGHPDIELIEDLDYKRATVAGDKIWVGDTCLNDLDLYAWYTVQDPVTPCFGLDVLEALSATTKVVPHPVSFANGLDKFRSHFILKRAAVAVADFVLFDHRNLAAAQELLNEWGGALLKPRRGNFGMGVTLVEDRSQLRDIADYVYELAGGRSPDAGFLLERFYPNDAKRWTSVVVVDGKVAYGYRKKPSKFVAMANGAKKVYDTGKVGGQVDICDVTQLQRQQAETAAEALGLPLVSFDMLDCDGTAVIIDENTYPGCYPKLLADGGASLARGLFDHLITQLTDDRHLAASHARGDSCSRARENVGLVRSRELQPPESPGVWMT